MSTTLIVGPVRAGKSARAAALARASGKPVTLLATAAFDPNDAEMRDRVERHRASRPAEWNVIEISQRGEDALAESLRAAEAGTCVVVDALGTWLGALLLGAEERAARDPVGTLAMLDLRGTELANALGATRAEVIVVAEETGWGVVPATPLGRIFRDALGRLTRRIACDAERVELVVAGYALDLRAHATAVDET
ncbi:MAG TPA: bifunctional adenosylcobinamide kinase/adenosylcobinamide-phosphate guanylyltransferase [Candidatus Elarobacter sp.]|jgi:adenosylcobinamide kinase/adenosylcobinamide-phosphate guanylyltransferase|nr:bifunctional adenosylcobinamide kinase/adenosylcobinamide-phosphate guanylyltransferase [Candidatus Elarobacter sp.]